MDWLWNLFASHRLQPVNVAVVYDQERGFFLGFNPKWGCYTFPMTKMREDELHPDRAALRALEEHVGERLPGAIVRKLLYTEAKGVSRRTGKKAQYFYQVYEITPGARFDNALGLADDAAPDGTEPAVPSGFGCRQGFIPYKKAMASDLVSWSTKQILLELMENQQVALAIITKTPPGAPTQVLLTSEGGGEPYFFPVKRIKEDTTPDAVVVSMIRDVGADFELDPGCPVRVRACGQFRCRQTRPRFNQQRRYVFHLCRVGLPSIDLDIPGNALEHALTQAGIASKWCLKEDLWNITGNHLSTTVQQVRDAIVHCMDCPEPEKTECVSIGDR
jgi:hypothetical protein